MAIPILMAVGAAITVTATCVAWLCDSATEAERKRHSKLMHDAKRTREKVRTARAKHAEDLQKALRQQAGRYHENLVKELKRIESEHGHLLNEVNQLEQAFAQELSEEQPNPFRRRTVVQSAARIEDARARLDAHRAYREDTAARLEQCWKAGHYDALLEIDPPTFTLPAEWLYIGKALLIEVPAELDRPLQFGQRLHLTSEPLPQGFSDNRQRQHMASYPDGNAVPIQVIRQDKRNPRKFFGCIARGIAYNDHILLQEPIPFQIERYSSGNYTGILFGGSIRATLPLNRLLDPGEQLRQGQTVPVWPDVYDLLLSQAPGIKNFGGRNQSIVVSARPPAEANPHRQRIALAVSEGTVGVELLEGNLPLDEWRLLTFDEANGRLQLINSRILVHCEIDIERYILVAEHCEQIPDNIDGLTIPLPIEPFDSRLADYPYLRSPEGLNYLQQLAMQAQRDPEREKLRAEQVGFLGRWREVMDYQQEEENQTTITFSAISNDDPEAADSWRLNVTKTSELEGDLTDWVDAYHQIAKENRRFKTSLEIWRVIERDGEIEEGWQPVPWGNRLEVLAASHQAIEIAFTARRGPLLAEFDGQQRRYRLTVERPDRPLQRQREALEAFATDRMVEPALKEILLTPSGYPAAIDDSWHKRVELGLNWRNSQLTTTQRQVIETALKASKLALIQGPPGTAKTTCIVEMLHQIYSAAPTTRVLLVSQQNAAVDNALDRFINSGGLADGRVNLLRIGHEDRIQPELQDHSLNARIDLEYQRWIKSAQSQSQHANPSIAELSHQWEQLVHGLRLQANAENGRTDPEASELLLNAHNLVGATCVGLANPWLGMDRLSFDIAIIDEAGRATVPELLIPLLRAHKAVLIGDHHQLPPTVAPLLREEKTREELPFLDDAFLQTSFFETLFRALPNGSRAQLREQYRMTPVIGDLVADLFYTEDGQRTLINGERKPDPDQPPPLLDEPLCWINVPGQQERGGAGKSLSNSAEANAIANFLSRLSAPAAKLGGKDVAVITPYRAQVRCITTALQQLPGSKGDNRDMTLGGLKIKVDTVDSFQGSEANLVCYSTVRTKGSLQFVLDEKRLNVACSRAQENLIFFGHTQYLHRHQQQNQRNLFAEIIPRATKGNATKMKSATTC